MERPGEYGIFDTLKNRFSQHDEYTDLENVRKECDRINRRPPPEIKDGEVAAWSRNGKTVHIHRAGCSMLRAARHTMTKQDSIDDMAERGFPVVRCQCTKAPAK
jgi:hypothetical protein